MVRLRWALPILAALVLTAPSTAQEKAPNAPAAAASAPAAPPAPPTHPPAHTVAPLTVTAPNKPDPKEVEALAYRFVRALSEPSRMGQLSRWMTPPCAKAMGLPDAFDAFVVARIASLADEVGAPKAPSPCRTNDVLVVFTTEPQKLLDFIGRRRSELLGFHYAAQTKRLTTFRGPVQAWYVTATVAGRVHYIDEEFQPMPGGGAGSRLSAGLASAFEAVLVIVDASKIAGQPIGRIADDVAMLTLARSPVSQACRDLPTILDALKPDCASSAEIDGLTGSDLAYLKGPYSADPTQFLNLQKSDIATSVAHNLEGQH
jgi:hypothetical protein